MGDRSAIEWTDATWSPVAGCSQVSPGCLNCYAIRETNRHRNLPKYAGLVKDGDWTGEVRCHPEALDQPLRWKKPRMIFVCSMSDLFHDKVPWEFIGKVFDVMIDCPQHTFQLLTKRPGRMAFWAEQMAPICQKRRLPWRWPPNVWAGTSVESQKYAPRLDCLLRVPAKVRFVSAEPLLSALDLRPWLGCPHKSVEDGDIICPECGDAREKSRWIHQVIVGGESGPGARAMHPDWARSLRDQCQAAGVPYFFKQWGEWVSLNDAVRRNLPGVGITYQFDDMHLAMTRVGKKAAGAVLDGREWREMPQAAGGS